MIDGEEIKTDLYGEGTIEGRPAVVVGEAESKIGSDDVRKFYNRIHSRLAKVESKRLVRVVFGYLNHPSAKRAAEEPGLFAAASYERWADLP